MISHPAQEILIRDKLQSFDVYMMKVERSSFLLGGASQSPDQAFSILITCFAKASLISL